MAGSCPALRAEGDLEVALPDHPADTLGLTQTQTVKHYLTRFQISCRGFFDYVQKRKTSQVKVWCVYMGWFGVGTGGGRIIFGGVSEDEGIAVWWVSSGVA